MRNEVVSNTTHFVAPRECDGDMTLKNELHCYIVEYQWVIVLHILLQLPNPCYIAEFE